LFARLISFPWIRYINNKIWSINVGSTIDFRRFLFKYYIEPESGKLVSRWLLRYLK
jgi:hypothetical protein